MQDEKPVLTGLIALVAVACVVGLLTGAAVLFGTRMLGIGGDGTGAGAATGGASLYLPTPRPTEGQSGPLITLAPSATPPSSAATASPRETATASPSPKREIALSASQTSVTSFEQIDLTGVYALGEGAILQVQRLESGSWEDFPVTVQVSNGTFSTYVQTSRPGINEFRVIDLDSGLTSNSVRVRVE